MRRLNVRCCCQPTKILGTLPWDETSDRMTFKLTGGGDMTLKVETITHLLIASIVPETANDTLPADVETQMIKREPAYKAEGAPLDQLRLIPEFEDGSFPTSEERAMSEANSVTEIGVGSAMAGRVIDRKIFETPVTVMANLTAFEQTIFDRLSEGKGEIVSKDELCKALYPNGPSQNPNSNGVEVFVMRLRKKIGEQRITTVRGRGYIFNADPAKTVTIEVGADQSQTAAAG